jgi:hypothetical protein
MRKFVVKTIVFIFSFMLIITISFSAIYFHFSKHPFRKLYHTVFLGDSRIQYLFKSNANFAYNSESFKFNYYKLLSLNKIKKTDTVFLGCSHHSFSHYFEGYLNNQQEVLPRYLAIDPEPIKMIQQFNFTNLHFLIKKQYEFAYNAIFKKYNFVPAGYAIPSRKKADMTKLKKRIQQQFYDHQHLMKFSSQQIAYFETIVQYCKKQQIQLILINSPVYPAYKSLIPNEYLHYYSAKTKGIQMLDLSDSLSKPDDFMPDGDHISRTAFDKTTKMIHRFRSNHSKGYHIPQK